jgi:DNA replication protein DnaC
MMIEQTIEKLVELRLHGMVKALRQWQDHRGQPLEPEDLVALLADAEWILRENNKLSTRLRTAKFKFKDACLENIRYHAGRGFTKANITPLASSRWVAMRQSILLTGATGSGKSWMACALGNKACRDGYSVVYRRTSLLLDELNAARAEGNYALALQRLARVDALILDDFCMKPLGAAGRSDLLEVLEDRYNTKATVIASQLDPSQWHVAIGDATFADSICDRLVHGAHRLNLEGESIRKLMAEERAKQAATLEQQDN